ncbi:hypothetical protein [Deinococcus peraridilitoris]|uniref:Uncharacterized protein n=1 Tax=Deinococcus peraridilitoris (strain DSM 19664 / LMG 22246 / CIP 109416 / KR-200) TaxID=937777 RepID=L0A1M3_DEIPD|nr:hypothetical protein [Deinococcus peraridilitoris]AFZ67072.1 hypothetical protein Deipe_1531 [Deinococcus peraridilitoris DSM 19664]
MTKEQEPATPAKSSETSAPSAKGKITELDTGGVLLEVKEGGNTWRVTAKNEEAARAYLAEDPDACKVK